MMAPPLLSVFVRLSGLMAEGRQLLSRHSMWFGVPDQIVMRVVFRLRSFDQKMQDLVALWRAGKLVDRTRPPRPRTPPRA